MPCLSLFGTCYVRKEWRSQKLEMQEQWHGIMGSQEGEGVCGERLPTQEKEFSE